MRPKSRRGIKELEGYKYFLRYSTLTLFSSFPIQDLSCVDTNLNVCRLEKLSDPMVYHLFHSMSYKFRCVLSCGRQWNGVRTSFRVVSSAQLKGRSHEFWTQDNSQGRQACMFWQSARYSFDENRENSILRIMCGVSIEYHWPSEFCSSYGKSFWATIVMKFLATRNRELRFMCKGKNIQL